MMLTTRHANEEMEELVFALGADLVGTTRQKRPQPDPQFYLGSGKLEEARDTCRALGADLVVVNAALKPGQIFSIQRFFNDGRVTEAPDVEVYDRTRLILEIFRERANSPEARLQVELAQLTYEMPLVKEAIHLLKKGERPGFLAGGSYEVEQYHDMMKRRMARIRRDLEKMRRERSVRRKHRRRGGFHLVSLAGYTNAGKSSLLRAVAEKDTLVENRYFSTLGTKTARAQSDRREMLVTDTVGFIEDLPPWMIEAFHSTLEEIALADVIVLVLDASDPVDEMARRLRSSLRILWQFGNESEHAGAPPEPGASPAASASGPSGAGASGAWLKVPSRRGLAPLLVALNKTDRVAPEELEAKVARLEQDGLLDPAATVRVSAKTREGLDELYQRLYEMIPDYDEYEVAIPQTPESESFIAWLYDETDVLDLTRGNEVHLHFEAKRSLRTTIQEKLAQVGGTPLREARRADPFDDADDSDDTEGADDADATGDARDSRDVDDAREAGDARPDGGRQGGVDSEHRLPEYQDPSADEAGSSRLEALPERRDSAREAPGRRASE